MLAQFQPLSINQEKDPSKEKESHIAPNRLQCNITIPSNDPLGQDAEKNLTACSSDDFYLDQAAIITSGAPKNVCIAASLQWLNFISSLLIVANIHLIN